MQPFYFDLDNTNWYKLTYSNYPLDNKISVGGDGTAEWNTNGDSEVNDVMSNQVIDQSNFTINGGTSSGTVLVTGDISIGSYDFELTHSYTLEDSNKFIKIETTLTNTGASSATNIRFWVGTRDDYIGTTDTPKKVRSNIVSSSLASITTVTQRSRALEISSDNEGVLFFTTYSNANTAVRQYSGDPFRATTINPDTVPIETPNAGGAAGPNDSS